MARGSEYDPRQVNSWESNYLPEVTLTRRKAIVTRGMQL